jgi:hypothetical protein
VSDSGEIRLRLQQLELELRQAEHERVRGRKARRRAALDDACAAARAELEAALAAPEPPTAEDWQLALTELAVLRMLEAGGDVDADSAAETVLELLDDYLIDAEPELAAHLFALDVDEIAFDAQLAYLRLL